MLMVREYNVGYNVDGFTPFFQSLVDNPEVNVLQLVLDNYGEDEMECIKEDVEHGCDYREAVLGRLLFLQDTSSVLTVYDLENESKVYVKEMDDELMKSSADRFIIPGTRIVFSVF